LFWVRSSATVKTRPSIFARFGDLALFLTGALTIAAGVVEEGAGQAVLLFIGATLVIVAAVLPRLSGTIKLSPGSVELTVVQQLDATRREAERRVPDQTEEAVGLAFEKLVESGQVANLLAAQAPAPRPKNSRLQYRRSPRLGLVVAAGVLLFGVVVGGVLIGETARFNLGGPTEEGRPTPGIEATPPVPERSPSDSAAVWPLVFGAVVALGVVAIALAAAKVRRRKELTKASSSRSESPEVFARRIVEEVVSNRPSG